MNIKTLFILACVGILAGLISVYVYHEKIEPKPPITVSYNPYATGIYATGIVESYQVNGSNVNIFPEVPGKVITIFVKDGQTIHAGDPLLALDDSVQRKIVEKDIAEIELARANLTNVQAQLDKISKSFYLDPKSVSKNTLDNAINAVLIDQKSLIVAIAQSKSDTAVLAKYIINSPIDGIILRVVVAVGDYVTSTQGTFDTYTQSFLPAVQMGVITPYLAVRCYLNEILIPKLPDSSKLDATLFIRGTKNESIALEYVNTQPYAIPNIQLSNERNERVDVRVLPILFKFKKPNNMNIFPGQLVDIYIKGKK